MTHPVIGKNLRHYRILSGFSQQALGLASHVDKKTICHIENGKLIKSPHPKTLRKLIKPLNKSRSKKISVEDLYRPLAFDIDCKFK